MLCCGAIVPWPRTKQVTEAFSLHRIQRLICLVVTGMMQTVFTTALETYLCLPLLDLHEPAFRLHSWGLRNHRQETVGSVQILEDYSAKVVCLWCTLNLAEFFQNIYFIGNTIFR